MSTHTPAPWTLNPQATNHQTLTGATVGLIADIHKDEDARLIAAAPELLAVLQDVREAWLAGRMGDVEGILTGDVCIEAINKALGDSHHG
jgi:hypothetical protein